MSVATSTRYDRGATGIITGLISLGGIIAIRPSAGTATSTELKTERFDVGARPNH